MYLSVIIPAYNEEDILETTIKKLLKYLSKKKYKWEIVVVDDGSKDNTLQIAKGFKKEKVSVVILPENKGKGAALREGFLKAKGKYQIYMDADLSVPIENIVKLMAKLKRYDVVVGSRRVEGAEIKVAQPWHREKMGQVYTFLTQIIVGMPDIKDFTCGFKGFSKKASSKIFKNALIDRWAYDSEILFLAKKYGFKIKQAPVVWRNRKETRVKLKSVIFESFKDLLLIRVNDILGKYNT